MKTVKAWAIVDKGGEFSEHRSGTGRNPTYKYKSAAIHECISALGYQVVRVEIRELKPKRKGKRT